ncbi:neuronal acetylcholine receptor subunit alpha-7-like [Mizuhopecten yessoensis]|uniref:Neuronal acetylcholine receptor subunit alpha-7 n=1 Tax=Mizuhopecten yessoensis TaxID=6573 RepID=A0A210R498_MIZYE|nr:neuronal acetylcholine receptor subunit alpha-7-like [Mizuhopecten yessoensis]OWF55903.1 Neuronal acetylcholine receptor subunit alpha-7 [Mizuhopecten yessoensis]
MATVRVTILLIMLYSTRHTVQGRNGTMDDWIRLTNTLFSNYTKEIFPLYNFSDTLNIDTSMFPLSMLDFDEVSGVITLSAGMTLSWNDYRLKWTPSDYGGIDYINLNSSKVWKPKVYVVTAADDLRQFGSDDFEIFISYTGLLNFSPGKLLRSTCTVDMTKFPVDTQLCSIRVIQWAASPHTKLTFDDTEMNMMYYIPNGEWNIDKTSVSFFMGYGSPSETLDFTIHMSRRYIYFIVSMTIPILLLCFLNPFVFLLPATSGERMSFTITMFLSLAVYMTLVGDNLPKVSENMAGMSYFLLLTLIYSSTLIVLTIFTLRCEAVDDVSQFPKWLRRLTRFCCKFRDTKVTSNPKSDKVMELKEQGGSEVEEIVDVDLECLCIKNQDVMKVIDNSLFAISFLVIVIMTLWFLCTYYA